MAFWIFFDNTSFVNHDLIIVWKLLKIYKIVFKDRSVKVDIFLRKTIKHKHFVYVLMCPYMEDGEVDTTNSRQYKMG